MFDLANPFVVAPMTTYASQANGDISPDELPYLERFGHGGFSAVITAACYVHPSGHAFRGQWGCDNEERLNSLSAAASAIHKGGARAILQIHHGGRQCPPDLAGGECVAPSAIPYPREGAATPRELTHEEIEEVIIAFGAAAKQAAKAGFDGVEIHGANTYLLQQFVSPASNRRTDQWRAEDLRFPLEVTRAVKAQVPTDFIVGYRLSPEEPEADGIRLEHTFALIDALIPHELDYLSISLREFDQVSLHDPASAPVLQSLAERVAGKMPLMVAGGISKPADAERAQKLGAEFLAIGRGSIYDRDFAQKMQDGKVPDSSLPAAFEDSHVLPKGLSEKIRAVPGWFKVEA